MGARQKFTVYANDESWIPVFKWFYLTEPNDSRNPLGHGPFPARWIARLAGRWHTR